MSADRIAPEDELALAEKLPQADATSLVDRDVLEEQVQEMYRQVARGEDAQLHFAVGRQLALRLGYPEELLDAIPAEALASFAGVGYHLDLAALAPGNACWTSARAREPTCFAPPFKSARRVASPASTSPTSRSRRPAAYELATASARWSSSKRASMLCRSKTAASTS
jgi:hypothetical protein